MAVTKFRSCIGGNFTEGSNKRLELEFGQSYSKGGLGGFNTVFNI